MSADSAGLHLLDVPVRRAGRPLWARLALTLMAHAQVNYFAFVAEEVRAGLAALGLRSLDELVGRADLLRQRDLPLAKTAGLDLSYITTFAGPVRPSSERLGQEVGAHCPYDPSTSQT